MSAKRQALVVLFALSAIACFPAFHDVPDTPTFSGRVVRHGKPVPYVQVRLYHNDPVLADHNRVANGKADGTGRFTIGPLREFRYFMGLVGNAGTDWRLEFVVDGVQYQGWQNRSLGTPSGMVDVECDLDDPVMSGNLGLRSTGEGFCRIVKEKEP